MGIVLNRVADAELAEAVPDLADVPGSTAAVRRRPVRDERPQLAILRRRRASPLVTGSIG
jgi:hypothetical protein